VYYISVGDEWSPPELTAYDEEDGIVEIEITGIYNLHEIGVYLITYTAIDSDDNIATYTIYLHVVEEVGGVPPSDFPEMDEDALSILKSDFQSDRSSLIQRYLDPFNEATYYASLNGLTGQDFVNQLHIILSSNIYPTSYGEARFILEKSDAINTPWGTYLYGIYSNHKIVRYWDGGSTWSREHVWPNSRLGVGRVGNSNRGIAADPHNLRAINTSVNSTRSNRYFINGTGSINETVGSNGYYPGDDHRGDVARILFYMYVRYLGTLDLVDAIEEILSGSSYEASGTKFGVLSVLIDWHYLDPVSDFELHRNDVIYSYQGNRNPFIDNPDYVSIIFNVESPSSNEIMTVTVIIPRTDINLSELEKRKYYYV